MKISIHLQASIQPFIWAHVAGPTSYMSKNVKLPKCWTSEVLHLSCPISNCPIFQTVGIFIYCTRTYLSAIPVFDIFKFFPVFSRDKISQRFCGLVFLLTLLKILLNEFLWIFSRCIFLLGLIKSSPIIKSFKGKCSFSHPDSSFRKIQWFV